MASDSKSTQAIDSIDYWNRAQQPLSCLLFLLPLLLTYEMGVAAFSQPGSTIRNGADFVMRSWLGHIGITHSLLLPALVVSGLLVWHVAGRYAWRISIDTLAGMFAESLLFALLLVAAGQVHHRAFQQIADIETLSVAQPVAAARAISFLGAGIYEEVLFRLCMLPMAYAVFRVIQMPRSWAASGAIVSTSLVFSIAHYIGPSADTFTMFSFSFRALAGTFFAALFVTRGFGITVGCHAAYDVLVGVLLTSPAD